MPTISEPQGERLGWTYSRCREAFLKREIGEATFMASLQLIGFSPKDAETEVNLARMERKSQSQPSRDKQEIIKVLREHLKIGGHDAWEGNYYFVDGIEAAATALTSTDNKQQGSWTDNLTREQMLPRFDKCPHGLERQYCDQCPDGAS